MNTYSKLAEDTQLHTTTKCNYFGENKDEEPAIFVLAIFYIFFLGFGLEGTCLEEGDRLGQSDQCWSNERYLYR